MDLAGVQSWIDQYVRVWETLHPQAITDLFAEGARYYTHPYREPWTGRRAIVERWLADPDPPGSWKADYHALAVNGNTGVVRGTTRYFNDDGSLRTEYANIYVIEFDDAGRAIEFTEWFMEAKPPGRD